MVDEKTVVKAKAGPANLRHEPKICTVGSICVRNLIATQTTSFIWAPRSL